MVDLISPLLMPVAIASGCAIVVLGLHIWRTSHACRSYLDDLLATSYDATLWTDLHGRIQACNPATLQIFGRSHSQLVDQSLSLIIPSIRVGQVEVDLSTYLMRVRNLQLVERVEGQAVDADGNLFPVSLTIKNIDAVGKFRHLAVIRDNSRQSLAQKELRRFADQLLLTKHALEQQNRGLEETIVARTEELRLEKERAESANAAKSDFLANMSHELRTPLHAILSFSRFGLRRANESTIEKLVEYFTNIETSGNTLLHLVNQLLDIAKLESGTLRLVKQPISLKEVADDLMAEFSAIATERGVDIQSEFTGDLPIIYADREKIAQVIRNLMGNALKVSPLDGRVVIIISSEERLVTVRVVDQGPGIPEDELGSIFEKFVQSTRTNTGAGGTGLGLAICKEIIALHGGRIWAENVRPHGAAVRFELPIPHGSSCDRRAPGTLPLTTRTHSHTLSAEQSELLEV